MAEAESASEIEAAVTGDMAEPPENSGVGIVTAEISNDDHPKSLEHEDKEQHKEKEEKDELEDAKNVGGVEGGRENENEQKVETEVDKREEENKGSEEKSGKEKDDKEMEDLNGEEENNGVEKKEDKEKEQAQKESEEQDVQVEEAKEGGDDVKMEEEMEVKNKESEDKGDSKDEKGTKKKRSRGRRPAKIEVVKDKDERETSEEMLRTPPAYYSADRPVRERKTVVRLVEMIEKEQSEGFLIEKGRGTPLKDIPNVAYKLSQKKPDDMKLLHLILFGRKGKAINFKSHISQFSGFVWHDNEDKQREKIREKLDKCPKDKLLDLCDILDIPVSAATSKKEDLVVKLLEFMIAPYATTASILAEKEKHSRSSGKRKRASEGSSRSVGSPTKHSRKRHPKNEHNHKPEKNGDETDEDDNEENQENTENGTDMEEDTKESDSEKENEPEQNEDKGEEDEDLEKDEEDIKKSTETEHPIRKSKPQKADVTENAVTPTSAKKFRKTTSPRSPKVEEINKSKEKVFSRKTKKVDEAPKSKSSSPQVDKEAKTTGRKPSRGKLKTKEAEGTGPSKAQLKKSICEILKEVDFNTATFTDILKQLASHFDTDLTARKESIKLMIKDELTKLAEEEAETSEDEDADLRKKEKMKSSGRRVKA